MSQAKHDADGARIGLVLRALGQSGRQPRMLVTQQRGVGELSDVLPLPVNVDALDDVQDADGNWLVVADTQTISDTESIG